jgi:hypothetical protein
MDTGTVVVSVGIVVSAVVAIAVGMPPILAARTHPRPHFSFTATVPGGNGRLPVRVHNAGSEAVRCHALAHVEDDFYEFRGAVAAQLQEHDTTMLRLGSGAAPEHSDVPWVLWVIAADGRNRWWDARTGRRIRRPINEWLDEKSRAARLPITVQVDLA